MPRSRKIPPPAIGSGALSGGGARISVQGEGSPGEDGRPLLIGETALQELIDATRSKNTSKGESQKLAADQERQRLQGLIYAAYANDPHGSHKDLIYAILQKAGVNPFTGMGYDYKAIERRTKHPRKVTNP